MIAIFISLAYFLFLAMDSVLTEFIQRTHADPALARDLLEATEWNVDAAEAAYHSLQDTHTVDLPDYEYNPSKPVGVEPAGHYYGGGGMLFK